MDHFGGMHLAYGKYTVPLDGVSALRRRGAEYRSVARNPTQIAD